MEYRWLGAALIVSGCGGFGFSMAARYYQEQRLLSQLIRIIHEMECELQYRLTPLPELCESAVSEIHGPVRSVFLCFVKELRERTAPDPPSCMAAAVSKTELPFPQVRKTLLELGRCLGKFDLSGQLKGLRYIKKDCCDMVNMLKENRSERMRCYQTLGFCAGAALAILFL